jgi:hypothetical protein
VTTSDDLSAGDDEITLPPGTLPIVPETDLLAGGRVDHRRTLLVHAALLRELLAHPTVDAHFAAWGRQGPRAAARARAADALDRLAQGAGLAARAALWGPETPVDETTQRARDIGWTRFLDEAGHLDPHDVARLVRELNAKLHLPAPTRDWLAKELTRYFLLALEADVKDRHQTLQYSVVPLPARTIQVRVDPTQSARALLRIIRERLRRTASDAALGRTTTSRMPKHEGSQIKRYVHWFVRHRLDGVTLAQLAREDATQDPEIAQGAHHRKIQYGIEQVARWLAATASAGSPRPRRTTTTRRAKRRRRR